MPETTYGYGLAPHELDDSIPNLSEFLPARGRRPEGRHWIDSTRPVDWTDKLGRDFDYGWLGNNEYNDCACAAYYHARQVWVQGREETIADDVVLQFYREVSGFDWRAPKTGKQPWGPEVSAAKILNSLRRNTGGGAPLGNGRRQWIEFAGEIKNDDTALIKDMIHYCGIVLVGFYCGAQVTRERRRWDYQSGDSDMDRRRHAAVLAGYGSDGFTAITWNSSHIMTWKFVERSVFEAYAIIDNAWIDPATGKTPAEQTLRELLAHVVPLTA
jgi:hypothetical protein